MVYTRHEAPGSTHRSITKSGPLATVSHVAPTGAAEAGTAAASRARPAAATRRTARNALTCCAKGPRRMTVACRIRTVEWRGTPRGGRSALQARKGKRRGERLQAAGLWTWPVSGSLQGKRALVFGVASEG